MAEMGRAMEHFKTTDTISSIYEGAGANLFDVTHTYFIRCDATNASVWQKSKLHVLTLQASCRLPQKARPMTFLGVGDLLPITSSTAESLLAIIERQVGSLGAPLWKDIGETPFIHTYVFFYRCWRGYRQD